MGHVRDTSQNYPELEGTALVGQGRPSEPSPKSSVTLEGTYTEPGALPNRAWKPLSVALDYELGN